MKWQLDLDIPSPSRLIRHDESLILLGSCFTNSIGGYLQDHYFDALANPAGIMFDAFSIVRQLKRMINNQQVELAELKKEDELYFHWDFHGSFADVNPETALASMNKAVEKGREALLNANHVLITLGTAYSYFYLPEDRSVANCHKVPAKQFDKRLMSSYDIEDALKEGIEAVREVHPEVQFVFTVSPVRHYRDGIIENNRSKARLLEAVHSVVESSLDVYYFPAYELVIDVLRDYRFYDIDLVHPNYAATEYVFERFCAACLEAKTQQNLPEFKQLNLGRNHRALHPETKAHQKFLQQLKRRETELITRFPYLNNRL
ncbi:MAG: GSCFA domain-containing protein [Bacteroidetes bacterium]|nr:MAG: GSCFA domain-containing protein [Bacteroidota bacterium]